MKITSISEQCSSATEVAYVTDPPLSPRIFEKFRIIMSNPYGPGRTMLNFKAAGGKLYIGPPSLVQKATLDALEGHLTAAEDAVNHDQKAYEDAIKLEQQQKEQVLSNVAKAGGRPLT